MGGPKDGASGSAKKFTADALMDKVDALIEKFDMEVAAKFCKKALAMEPDNLRVLDTAGPILMEIGDFDTAVNCFEHAIELEPDSGAPKYMYMGQIVEGLDAVKYFRKGIEIMKDEMDQISKGVLEGDLDLIKGEIATGLCSIAEIYLTDACHETDAEQQCKDAINEGLQVDPNNCEIRQALASYFISKEQIEDAKKAIADSMALWEPALSSTSSDVVLPQYPFRISTAKILIELKEHEKAFDVLERLLQEDDEVVQVWYLMGWVYYLCEEKAAAKDCLLNAQRTFEKVGCDDVNLVQHIGELLAEMEAVEVEEEPMFEDGVMEED
eukprot:Nk52_evm9s621 gene=Nk52_evmTU9s621